ncbi:hypothetical protein BpHYR1_035978, partial [Brachionus plicatilis]
FLIFCVSYLQDLDLRKISIISNRSPLFYLDQIFLERKNKFIFIDFLLSAFLTILLSCSKKANRPSPVFINR